MAGNFDGIKNQKFGVEIECTGLTREKAAKAIAKVLNGTVYHFGGGYDQYTIRDEKDRKWKVVYDSSIRRIDDNGNETESKLFAVEVVTPILEYYDMNALQNVVRAVRRSGGICNDSTGIHIHIDAAPYNAAKVRNLVNIFASKEDMLYQALQVKNGREDNYCKKVEKRFLDEINRKKPKNMEALKKLWYGDDFSHDYHYDPSRYRALNLHSLFTNDNIEIRAFNGSLHAGVIRAYISLTLAVSNQALTQKYASPRVTESSNPKYTFRTWLIRIGLNGDEFKNCRKHLLSHLEGNIAWLHQEDAVAQRERLKQERIAAREASVSEENEQAEEQHSEDPESDLSESVGDLEETENTVMTMTM